MQLVIVESPTKIKSLSKYLGAGYDVQASMGHIVDLPKSKMGVEIKKIGNKSFEFVPEYGVVKGKSDQVKRLKTAAKRADSIILATDPDREGEAIAYHVGNLLGEGKKVSRITFHSITKEAILEALEHPGKLDMAMVDAQQARRVLDRLVGYELSPVLWRKVRRGLSAGRVQSVAVRLIVEREGEIEAFKPVEYWEIRVEVVKQTGKKEGLWLELMKVFGKKASVGNAKTAAMYVEDLKSAEYKVSLVEKKERKAYAKPPFKTSTLQQAAANVMGWTSKKTMTVAQSLYEQGNITYHRTDSLNLAPSAVELIRKFIGSEFGAEYVPAEPNVYKTSTKVVAQEAHEAIRPTDMNMGTNSFVGSGEMGRDQEKLYGLIWRRTISCQMKPAVFDSVRVDVSAEGEKVYTLVARGETMKFDGWRKLYRSQVSGDRDQEQILPEMNKDEELDFKDIKSEQKFTLPPPRYNDASLIKELEKRGIGRPSTYASIVATIIARRYVDRKERKFYPTSVGKAVVEFLVKNFPVEMEYEFTAKMEEDLDDIARGKQSWQAMLSDFYGPFSKQLDQVKDKSERVGVEAEKTGKKCPECGQGDVVIREGKYGKFLSCSRFPECKYTGKLIEYVEGVVCEKCGGKIMVKKTRTGREFFGCENYPKCDWASWKRPVVPGQEESNKEAGDESRGEDESGE
ncbi:DNA topoisomerase I [Candidatus Collierbacteria bacterium RIFOXYB1_FULL_49_13]|uniref:DNA topoisomerase 1 n=1 Tax=Candidatus Collierbacteria bacterium RIFOXYB1_FULL_49_13 TaxID=1817728 RepID=A0A1F5FI95_9BACT|nr:MAG: DNA topoisomerase I [Candidatus Collierbacteria bacterium RIFOXYB1_FULL_49_13]